MAHVAQITIYQYKDDPDFKSMIDELIKNKDESNPYRLLRSKSDLVKAILATPLRQEHKKYGTPAHSKPKPRKKTIQPKPKKASSSNQKGIKGGFE